jgi:hypothetical protein
VKKTAELNCETITQHTLSVTLREIPQMGPEDKCVIEVTIYPDTEYGQGGKPLIKRMTLSYRDMLSLTGNNFEFPDHPQLKR